MTDTDDLADVIGWTKVCGTRDTIFNFAERCTQKLLDCPARLAVEKSMVAVLSGECTERITTIAGMAVNELHSFESPQDTVNRDDIQRPFLRKPPLQVIRRCGLANTMECLQHQPPRSSIFLTRRLEEARKIRSLLA